MRKTVYHIAGAAVKIAALYLLIGRAACAVPPAIGIVRLVSPAVVEKYEKVEFAFPVRTAAPNIFLPFDPHVPAYADNLKPDEDARSGISVDALVLPPGVTDWARARVQPAFWFQPYAPAEPVPPHHPTDLLLVNGLPDWHVRFAPDKPGLWHYKIRVMDKNGIAVGSVGTFRCVASQNAGFVRVSPGDTRYLARDDGQVCPFVGDNFQARDDVYHTWARWASDHGTDGAQCLLRLWLGGRNGLEVYGGFANSDGGRTWSFGEGTDHPCILRGDTAHAGRFCVQISADGTLAAAVPIRPGLPYTVSAWVRTEGTNETSLHIGARPSEIGGSNAFGKDFTVGEQWSQVSLTVPGLDPQQGAAFFLATEFRAEGGPVLIDDITVTGSDGRDALGIGDFERHVRPNLRQAWLLDNMVDSAARASQFLRLVCFENDDSVFCNVDGMGKPATHDDANFYGRTNDSQADLPVRRWQRYAMRYLIARYSYSMAVAEWEFCNEGPSYNGNHYAAAEAFAHTVHGFKAQGHRLAGTSFYQNSSAPSYVPEFYENPLYPDIDYADVHYYPGRDPRFGSFLPFNNDVHFFAVRGFAIDSQGGPNGWGRLTATAQSILPWKGTDPNFAAQQFPLFRVRGQGRWTLSGWFRQSADARFSGPGPVLKLHVPNVGGKDVECVASPPLGKAEQWTHYSSTFTMPDDSDHIGATLRYEATNLTAGRVGFSGLTLTGPDGRDRVRIRFNEPQMDTDTAALAQYLPLDYTGLSGDAGIGKPLSIGETDYLDNNVYNPDLARDVQGVWLRQWAWAHLNPSGAVVFWWYSPTANHAGGHGFWRYVAGYQRFLQDVPLANGRYRNIQAQTEDPHVQIIGQADLAGTRAHFFVYNSMFRWYAQAVEAKRPVLQMLAVTVSGLPDGLYSVQTWDTVRGIPMRIEKARARNRSLRVTVSLRAGEAAVKIIKSAP